MFKALELGALDFIAKPGGRVSPRLEEIQRDLEFMFVARMEEVLQLAFGADNVAEVRRKLAAKRQITFWNQEAISAPGNDPGSVKRP